MVKFIVLALLIPLFVACGNGKNMNIPEQEEDFNAKKMLQGIWLDDETESPLMRIEGDTIYYADSRSAPIAFKIWGDTIYTYGNDSTCYKIDKQAEHIFWFHSLADNIVKLHKSDDPNDSLAFAGKTLGAIPTYTEVVKRDSLVSYNGIRYRAYAYINPSNIKVVKTTYSEDGISMDNVYYDNIMHICVYEGKKCLYASDITKQMFNGVVPADFLVQSILSDIHFMKVDHNGFHYQIMICIPESLVCSVADLTVNFEGELAIAIAK